MLSLRLKEGQYIDIGENIRVVFAGYEPGTVKLLVDAPKEVPIQRSNTTKEYETKHYKPEQKISKEAQQEIGRIYKAERAKKKHKETVERRIQQLQDETRNS